ncbi:hypothetical protein C1701_02505 [Actinoalloteichus sp. AHMU CJ021]|uniref:hypothetical protein n=1 Tax=Actinoalloteichus TaxID=65496 RepID=UPI0004AA0DDF|nr:hypothetical protein [Actinoalloteichus caeruleus]AUS77426.1 hypothetical protein C1701_02505 [Actinoalloteichus sp. AHMU CJ021]
MVLEMALGALIALVGLWVVERLDRWFGPAIRMALRVRRARRTTRQALASVGMTRPTSTRRPFRATGSRSAR